MMFSKLHEFYGSNNLLGYSGHIVKTHELGGICVVVRRHVPATHFSQ